MKITIEWTVAEIKELWLTNNWLTEAKVVETKDKDVPTVEEIIEECNKEKEEKIIVNNQIAKKLKDWISYSDKRITLRYKWKEISISKFNVWAKKENEYWKLMTFDEAVKHCKRLTSMHLPTAQEWSDLVELWANWKGYRITKYDNWLVDIFSSDNENKEIWEEFSNDFKLPFAGYRNVGNANVNFQGSYARYWSSSPAGGGSDYARNLNLYSDGYVYSYGTDSRGHGFSVRCFKNSYGS